MSVLIVRLILLVSVIATALGGLADPIPVVSVKPWPSSSGSTPNQAFDGSQTTSWISSPCRAGSWRTVSQLNVLNGACGAGYCSGSCSGDLTSSTDNSPYTAGSAGFSHGEGRSWASFPFPTGNARKVNSIYIRGAWPVDTTMYDVVQNGTRFPIASLQPTQNYLDVTVPAPQFPISGLYVQAQTKDGVMRGYCYSGVGDCKGLSITEVAVQTEDCYEELSVDLGSNKVLTRMDVRFNGFVDGGSATSLDDSNYVGRIGLKTIPSSYFTQQKVAIGNVTARYVRVR